MSDHIIPYGHQVIEDDDVSAVVQVLRSEWLTTGPAVDRFEEAFAAFVGAPHAVAVSNGTAALHLCMLAAGIGPGDEVIVPAMTFAASANCARYVGATVVFADVRPDTLTIDVEHAASLITPRTRAIVGVDYAGLPCDLGALMALAKQHDLIIVEDAAHALGASYGGRPVGSIAHLTVFSTHPVKHITTGEGGVVATGDPALYERLRRLRNHGIIADYRQRESQGVWRYDMAELGFNYRLPDIQCALGLSQLAKLSRWLDRRRSLAAVYHRTLGELRNVERPVELKDRVHAWHLYPVRITGSSAAVKRQELFTALRNAGIGVNVHYLPVYQHSYYRSLGYQDGLCPVAEDASHRLLSLPMWHGLTDTDQSRVVEALGNILASVG